MDELAVPRLHVMPALGAGIHVLLPYRNQDMDGRNKSGHDAEGRRVADVQQGPGVMGATHGPSSVIAGLPRRAAFGVQPLHVMRGHRRAKHAVLSDGYGPRIHDESHRAKPYDSHRSTASWIAGSSPAMTTER